MKIDFTENHYIRKGVIYGHPETIHNIYKELEKLRTALEFYANKDNWDFDSESGGYIDDTVWTEISEGAGCFTSGHRAREALKEKK